MGDLQWGTCKRRISKQEPRIQSRSRSAASILAGQSIDPAEQCGGRLPIHLFQQAPVALPPIRHGASWAASPARSAPHLAAAPWDCPPWKPACATPARPARRVCPAPVPADGLRERCDARPSAAGGQARPRAGQPRGNATSIAPQESQSQDRQCAQAGDQVDRTGLGRLRHARWANSSAVRHPGRSDLRRNRNPRESACPQEYLTLFRDWAATGRLPLRAPRTPHLSNSQRGFAD